jgi:tRNA G18 (ribose-2'-O)-methylase SpoU
MKLNAQQLRTASKSDADKAKSTEKNPLYLILENVYDTYNIGGLFRLADGLNVAGLYICGNSEVPPNPKIKKASIGTYKVVPWKYCKTVKEAISDIKSGLGDMKLTTVAVEQDPRSTPHTSIIYEAPTALIVGNETFGVLPETVAAADYVAEIPMWGINKSLNVIVSAAVVSFEVMRQIQGK